MRTLAGKFLITLLLTLATSGAIAQSSCRAIFAKSEIPSGEKILAKRGAPLPERSEVTKDLAQFAEEFNLKSKWVEFGPPERRVKRLLVAIDATNPAQVDAYLRRYNLRTPISEKASGTLVVEFQKEDMNQETYVSGVLRTGSTQKDPVFRYGLPDKPRDRWWNEELTNYLDEAPEMKNSGIMAFGHLIELSPGERKNVERYLRYSNVKEPNPMVAPCKSSNCIAWMTQVELGKTAKKSTDEERKFLFTELGVARSLAHFEIGRRLMHASSDRHTAIVVLVNGKKGLQTFEKDLEAHLVPEPKTAYASIIRGVKISSPAQSAVDQLPDGAKVFIPIAAGASPDAVNALITRAPNLKKGFDVHVLVNGISEAEFRRGVETSDGKFRLHALFLGGNLRKLNAEKKVSVIPGNLSDFTRMMRDPHNPHFHYDAMVVRVSPPDKYGRYSLGPNNDMIMTILRDRPGIKVIAEVNENVPFTNGKNILTENQIWQKFSSKTSLAGPAKLPRSWEDTEIGQNLAKLIDSDSTLQIGIGSIFSGLPEALVAQNKTGIKISTEMLGDPMMEMIENKTAVKAETGFAFGSAALYKWLHKNRKVKFVETEYVNSPGRVAKIPNFHAVNAAVQVNLFGEVNATMGPNGRISSPGGQVEFMSGASRSEGGKAIITLKSTALNHSVSTITLDLYRGPITTPSENVTHVVTEYGIASLRGKNESERATAILSIAHPKFRPELIQQALERGIISQAQAVQIPLT